MLSFEPPFFLRNWDRRNWWLAPENGPKNIWKTKWSLGDWNQPPRVTWTPSVALYDGIFPQEDDLPLLNPKPDNFAISLNFEMMLVTCFLWAMPKILLSPRKIVTNHSFLLKWVNDKIDLGVLKFVWKDGETFFQLSMKSSDEQKLSCRELQPGWCSNHLWLCKRVV